MAHDITWWRHQMETFSALLALCAGNSPVHGEFPTQRPVTLSFDVFFDMRLNKQLNKQTWGWWFERLSRPLWRHRNDKKSYCLYSDWSFWHSILRKVSLFKKKKDDKNNCSQNDKVFFIYKLWVSIFISIAWDHNHAISLSYTFYSFWHASYWWIPLRMWSYDFVPLTSLNKLLNK